MWNVVVNAWVDAKVDFEAIITIQHAHLTEPTASVVGIRDYAIFCPVLRTNALDQLLWHIRIDVVGHVYLPLPKTYRAP